MRRAAGAVEAPPPPSRPSAPRYPPADRCPTPAPSAPHLSPCARLLSLLATAGTGQQRAELPAHARRHAADPQLWTHLALLPAILAAAARDPPLRELAALQSVVLVLSCLYHRNYERPGVLAKGEGASAKALFLYGVAQTVHSPTVLLACANTCCFALTAGVFVATNFDKRLYERWHPWGLHVLPGVWSTLIALNHAPLLLP
ncbi:hypothetical protein AB1Y20_018034 [Prymnesium parvum]|uniref:GPI mannosyltransferase 2 n=1 Tax=Prymnesium parvum TaxID=97485 RepID=A0AB34JQW7_PRYPA